MRITVTEFEPIPKRVKDRTGDRYGRLKLVGYAGIIEKKSMRKAHWWAECDCGGVKLVSKNNLKNQKSCGCIRAEKKVKRANMVCLIEGCSGAVSSKGYCESHYKRHLKYGDPLKNVNTPKGVALSWLLKAVKEANPDKCVIWPFGMANEYGVVYVDGVQWRAHRYALYLHTGTCPREKIACHGPCNNPSCINPYHLSWGTDQSNSDDKRRDGTFVRGERIGVSKLTEEKVLAIRADDREYKHIAAEYGIDRTSVSVIKNRKSWAWLEPEEVSGT